MFAESRSNRPKVYLYLVSSAELPITIEDLAIINRNYPQGLVGQNHYRLKLKAWEYLVYRLILCNCHRATNSRAMPSASFAIAIKKVSKFLIYSLLLMVGLVRQSGASAQSFEPITPDRDRLPQPQPLPPANDPLNDSIDAPPVPESLLDIPGTVIVEEFVFQGGTVFTQAELNQAIAAYTGKPISFAQLVRAADMITQLYVKQGYITSGAYLPEQNLSSGKLQIQIVEGSLSDIEVNVTKGRLNPNYIRDRLKNRVTTPLNINRLQSALQLLQLNPLIESLNAELSAGIQSGTNLLKVSVVGADTFTLQARLNNERNPSVGSFERGIKLTEANLFGIGDEIDLGYFNTDGSDRYEFSYKLPLNSRDGTLDFEVRLTDNEIVEAPFDEVDLDIKSRSYNVTWRQPILQRATSDVNQELALNFTASRRESDTTILDIPESISPGVNEAGEIRTTAISFDQEWLQRNRRQVIAARSQFNFGLDAFGATVSNNEPDSQFFAWRGQASYLRLLSTPKTNSAIGSTMLLRSQLQLATEPLIPTEQFSLGGAATVRGYRQDALITDSGFSASAELRLPIFRFSQLNANFQLAPFVDFGVGWNTDDEATEFSTLLGTGMGLILQTESRFSARIDWGLPLINDESENDTLQESGVYFQLQYDLF